MQTRHLKQLCFSVGFNDDTKEHRAYYGVSKHHSKEKRLAGSQKSRDQAKSKPQEQCNKRHRENRKTGRWSYTDKQELHKEGKVHILNTSGQDLS